MSEYRTNKDGSTTIGPVDKALRLVEALAEFAEMTKGNPVTREEMRRLAWFLGDKGEAEAEAARAIMEHAKVAEVDWSGWTPWGYIPTPKVP